MRRKRQRKLSFNLRHADAFGALPPGELLIEQITGERLRALRDQGETVRKYQFRQFFELEAQRALHKEKITAALQSVAGIQVDINGWCRAIKLRYGHALLSCLGTTGRLMTTFMDPSWRAFLTHVDVPANSQVFGQLVSAAGFEGIRYNSVRTGAHALAIFPRCFRNSSSIVRVLDPPPGVRCIELRAGTYEDTERQVW